MHIVAKSSRVTTAHFCVDGKIHSKVMLIYTCRIHLFNVTQVDFCSYTVTVNDSKC